MDRGVCRAIVHGVTVRHNLVTKQQQRYLFIHLYLYKFLWPMCVYMSTITFFNITIFKNLRANMFSYNPFGY